MIVLLVAYINNERTNIYQFLNKKQIQFLYF